MDAIYFVEPVTESWERIKADFRDKSAPMYNKAYLFFTSKVPDSLFAQVKQQPNLLARLGGFSEVNIEFLSVEPQIFTVCAVLQDRPIVSSFSHIFSEVR